MKKIKRLLGTNNKAVAKSHLSPPKADPSNKNPKSDLNSGDNIVNILEINGDNWHSVKLLSEKDIKELIEQKRYFKADQHLIKLEYELFTNDATGTNEESSKKEKTEIDSLYELLSAEIFTVVKESMNISKEHPNLLKEAVQVKIQEGKADQTYLEEKEKSGSIPEGRPRQWDTKWLSVLQDSVNERIGEFPTQSDDNKVEWLAHCLTQLRSQLKADFDTIVKCIKPCYLPGYDISAKYAECYHKKVSSHIALFAENGLKEKEVHPLLYWIYNCYPDIMIALLPSEDARQQLLNTLLPERAINNLKNEYLSALQSDARKHMINGLRVEQENWSSEEEPLVINGCYHSELPIDIIQIINGAVRDTGNLTYELGDRALSIMLEETNYFLESFQSSAELFEKRHFNHPNFIPVVIAIINSCETIRDYLNKNEKITNVALKDNILSILNEVEKRRKDTLIKILFCKLKPHCKMLVTAKWLDCPEPIDKIFEITEEHLTELKKLKPPQYQDLLKEIHKQLITEYILRIMKRRLNCKTENQQKQVADQIQCEADQLWALFCCFGSEATYLRSALPEIAEIIRLKDVDAIIIEVAALFQDFPDVGKEQIRTILHMKVNVTKSDEKKILNILNAPLNNVDSSVNRKLFSNSTLLKAI
ncbi:tumor necrosis factor alpha-induced protein 2-like [Scyliorhinus canicula]|uniref:tumor necrosis factor alpha-induced protein 2-like n=1 Tax=Scyliorhinus canicula TaxID=7830 RepID=UPI0018F56F04|nr:tumor necrosis factor alpha-induced protein 2-like [Scyliorhinus canicula]XP_038633367.1 tumor necrosis factor alpha-induced protein 2-like [Scyliorhinus canicula]XP_038633377.1 tumor necrosis factor alpha-induced protein 2-like [Scyliorhinus canicula]XP_038633387.1 tumor necrosis factor alpha-induced protein 2-like [Scyliorhinus canicula]